MEQRRRPSTPGQQRSIDTQRRINGDLETYRNRMRAEGLLVGRNFPPMLDHNRLSFGLPDEMAQWADAIKSFRQKGWI